MPFSNLKKVGFILTVDLEGYYCYVTISERNPNEVINWLPPSTVLTPWWRITFLSWLS